MSELIKTLIDQSEKRIEKIIKQLSAFASKQRYQLQCVILNHIIEKAFELSIKTKEFWHYVKTNRKSWDFHYQNERAFEKAFSTLSDVINSIAKTRNIYDEAFKKIDVLWDSTKEAFARNQFVQVLRSLRRCALRSMRLKEACRDVAFAIENRLNNATRDVSTSRESVNRNWIKITNENHDLRQIKIIVIKSSSFVVRLEKEKNREITLVVLFFSIVLSSIKKERNQKTIFVDFFFRRTSSSSSLTSSSIVSESLFASQSISSWSSSTLKDIIMMSEALLKNEDCLSTHFDESLLTELIHNASSSFVLSSDSIFFVMFAFVSLFFVSIVLASSARASRFRKRTHESFSSASQKRCRLTNDHYDCTLSSKWLNDLKNARCVESVKRVEHFLSELYYLDRQICKKHINQLKQLFELLSIENFVEMKKMLWEFLKFDEEVEIFKSERSDLFEIFENDD
jgi:hypothetical protein